jgi:AcrR family transcriptional regulator
MQRLRERKKERVRREIMDAALRLFAARGYKAARISDIAALAEIGEATLYRYFPSKEDLLRELNRDAAIRHFGRLVAAGSDTSTEENLCSLVRSFFQKRTEYVKANPWLRELAEMQERRLERDAYEAAKLEPLFAVIADGQRRGEIDGSLDPRLLAQLLWAMLSTSTLSWRECDPEREAWTKHCETTVRVFFRGVRAAAPPYTRVD